MSARPSRRLQSKALLKAAVFPVAFAAASPAAAQVCSLPLLGVVTCPAGDPNINVDVNGTTDPIRVVLDDGFNTVNTVNVATLLGGDVTIDTLTTSAINTVNQPGLVVDSGGNITARITDIATQGNGATGALLRAVDDVIFVTDGTVSTLGNAADAINIQGRSVTVNGNIIRTGGDDSDAADLVALDGPINLNANLLETNGLRSNAALLRGGGPINLNVGVLRTNGDQALGATISNDAAACVLLGNGGCNNSLTASNITTNGFGSIGALVNAVGDTTVNVDTLQTGGDEAAGLTLNADPTACATLGVGACDTAFTVNNLTTNGANAPGAVVRAAGNVTGNVRVLRTNGANSAGLDIASNPDACVLLGAGGCGTSFSVGQLTTNGPGSIGALVRAAGPTTANLGTVDTLGLGSTGVDIAGDPTACVLLGAGACDVGLTANRITTQGDGAAGVLINTPAHVLAQLGLISTAGDNAAGVNIVTDPALCLVLGPGACSAQVATGPVTTGGDNSPGVSVTSPGPIDVSGGPITTTGDNSPGVDVNGGEGPITVNVTQVTTSGDNSPGVDVTGTGPITVTTGTVTTSGDGSDGIHVVGADDPVIVTAGNTTTSGANSDGIDVTTTTGNQTITTGTISVTGPGSNGVNAVATGCGNVNITANGAVSSAAGIGINAASACTVTVTTLPGAPVSGAVAGINVVSGTGSTVTIGDRLSATSGLALNADGAGANVTVAPTGTLVGRIDLTDANDTLTNNGRFEATGDSAFGAGTDAFVNTGTLAVRPGATTAGAVTFTGLESTTNAGGLIDLRNGVTGDTLTLPGTFTGTGNSRLGLDVQPGTAGGTGDRLIVGGAATGSTTVLIDQLTTTPGALVNGLVVVDAGAGTSANAFTLAGGATTNGLITYNLAYDAPNGNFLLYGVPNGSAYELGKLQEGARQIFYRTDDAIGAHLDELGDLAASSTGEGERPRSSALWAITYGNVDKYDRNVSATAFGQTSTVSMAYKQDMFGGQAGYDFGSVAGTGSVVGVTAGYANSLLRFSATGDRYTYSAVNGGVYGRLGMGGFFLNAAARYEHYWIDVTSRSAGFTAHPNGDSYGAMGQVGFRAGSGGFFFEPSASIEYVRTSIDTVNRLNSTFDFDDAEGLRGKAGARIGTNFSHGATDMSVYIGGNVVHEFKGEDRLAFANNGATLGFGNDPIGTYGQAKIGFSAKVGSSVSGFIEAHGDYGDDYKGGGGRAGISIRF